MTAEESAPPRIAPAGPADLDDATAALLALTENDDGVPLAVIAILARRPGPVVVADGPTPPTLDELVDDIPRSTATGQIDRSTLADRLGG